MENLVGILYEEEQKRFGVKVDPLIDFTKFKGDNRWVNLALTFAEKKDDDLFSALIKFLDDRFGEKIPVNLKPSARAVALAFLDDDLEAFEKNAPVLINLVVDIPKIPEETEAIIISGVLQGIISAMGVTLGKTIE